MNRGFSLIELLIVVAIIGILTAIAIPNMVKYQSRARQTEAKANLKNYYASAKASFAESGKYTCGDCGYSPGGAHMYNYYLAPSVGFLGGSLGCAPVGIPAPLQTDPDPNSGVSGGFTAGATANIDLDPLCDGWTVNDGNQLTSTTNDF